MLFKQLTCCIGHDCHHHIVLIFVPIKSDLHSRSLSRDAQLGSCSLTACTRLHLKRLLPLVHLMTKRVVQNVSLVVSMRTFSVTSVCLSSLHTHTSSHISVASYIGGVTTNCLIITLKLSSYRFVPQFDQLNYAVQIQRDASVETEVFITTKFRDFLLSFLA